MSDRILIATQDGVADVRLNRPDKMNALDAAMFEALVEAGKDLAGRRDLRAVVLSGEGRAFSAGLDFTSFAAMAGGGAERPTRSLFERGSESPANHAQRAAWVWREVPVPVIAAIHGVAYGGGLQVALGADVRFVAPDAKLSVMEIKWGLVPDMSGTQTLRHLVRLDVAKELTFTGRILNGREAVELGLATRVADDPRAAALAMAREIAQKSPSAIRAAKRLLNEAVVSDVAAGLALEQSLQTGLLGRPNQVEAVKANLEKRAPRFADPEA
ncbi:MAG TPA: crotonase/enoyl-CoA hydratase family protein [Myxococcota bacterium]|jgi:enoyl-CoA hydratase/carnithine racemase|nr:crotonase/enoyl-CoA hydratase family protein [Myxococcota bacterium]